jgi:hypothetical protein
LIKKFKKEELGAVKIRSEVVVFLLENKENMKEINSTRSA